MSNAGRHSSWRRIEMKLRRFVVLLAIGIAIGLIIFVGH
jgi:hypothetical protein